MGVLHADAVRRTGCVLAETSQFAMTTSESWDALAVISAHVVDALTAISTGFDQALIQIKLAILTLEACRTVADIGAVIIITYAIIQARIRLTFVDVYVTVETLIASSITSACIIIDPVDADATILARIRSAFIDISFTLLPSPTRLTLALILAVC